jgi:hypothetical protein
VHRASASGARRVRFFILVLSFQLLDRGVIRAVFLDRRAHFREESAQTKDQTMKETIGLEKRTKEIR